MVHRWGLRAPKRQALCRTSGTGARESAKVAEVILISDFNVRLQKQCDAQEEELATVMAACGLEDKIAHFMPRRRYRGNSRWKWRMRREERQVTGRGIISSAKTDTTYSTMVSGRHG